MNCCTKNISTDVDDAERKHGLSGTASSTTATTESAKGGTTETTAKDTERTTTTKSMNKKSSITTIDEHTEHESDTESNSQSHWNSYNPDTMAPGARYSLCISAVVPRPIGVLTTVCPNTGVVNCAPYSYTGLSTHDPPIVTHGLCLSRGVKKDTLRNIEATGEWVFNVLEVSYLEQANQTSAPMPPEMSEIDAAKLLTTPCEIIKPPRLLNARVSMECKLIHSYEVRNDNDEHSTTIVMGRVVRFHIHNSVLVEGREDDAPLVELEKLQPVGRAGGITYWPVGVARRGWDGSESDDELNGSVHAGIGLLMERASYPPPFTSMERRQSAQRRGSSIISDGNEMGNR